MSVDNETERFIRSVFGSIWALELLLILRQEPEREWSHAELIDALRASDQVLMRSCTDLRAANLIAEQHGRIRYAPASADQDAQVALVAAAYKARPLQVRR